MGFKGSLISPTSEAGRHSRRAAHSVRRAVVGLDCVHFPVLGSET